MSGHGQIDELLSAYAESMRFERKERVLEDLVARRAGPRRRPGGKAAALAVAAALLISGTVLAAPIGGWIRQFRMRDMTITQVDALIAEDGERLSSQIAFPGAPRASVGDITKAEWVDLCTVERAEAALGRTIPKLDPPPAGSTLRSARALRYETGEYGRGVDLSYGDFFLSLSYLGPNGSVDFRTVEDMERIDIGGAEAALSRFEGGDVELHWKMGDWFVQLRARSEDRAMQLARSLEP